MANQFPGDFSLKEVWLYPHFGDKVDIKNLVGEITLYESVLSASLQCTIFIQDIGENLINTLPIMGEERIQIIIQSNNIWYDLNYYIYKIDGRTMKEKNQTYVMTCISVEGLRNENFRICERVDGKKSEVLVEEILAKSNFTRKKLKTDKSVYPFKMYVPNWRPFDTIIWLARRSVPIYKKDSIGFLFYETFDGFSYRSIDVLFDQPRYPNEKIKYIYFQGNQKSTGVDADERFRVMNYASPKAFDMYDDLRRGAFAHECIYVDLNHRSYRVFRSNADDFWDKSSHLDRVKPYKTETKGNAVQLLQRGSRFIYRPSTQMTWGAWDESQSTQGTDNIDEVNKNFEKAFYRYYFLEYNHMEISVPGDLENRCGNVIYLSIPSPKKNPDGSVKEDERVSGRYLVNSIKHTILNRSELRTTITLTRDSFGGKPVPDKKETRVGQIMLEGKN
jgi:hypothetical protein